MSRSWKTRSRKVLDWLADEDRGFRALEAYAIALLAFGTIIFSVIIGNLPAGLYNAVTLACLGFLVLATVRQRAAGRSFSIADVLHDRDDYGSFGQLLDGASDLSMYAPSGVNVLPRHLPDIRRWVEGGGYARLVVHDPAAASIDSVREQLDENTDFGQDLQRSLDALARHAIPDRLEYRLLGINPGFSMVVVNRSQRSGRVILEFHGFHDDKIGDRMHLVIRRAESVHWFEYWAGRFEAIWDAARGPGPDGRVGLTRVPANRTEQPEARTQ
jgi:hypothetical protein